MQIVDWCQRRCRSFAVSTGQKQVPDRRQRTVCKDHHGVRYLRQLLNPKDQRWYHRQDGADQGGVEEKRHRRLGPGQNAGQEVVGGPEDGIHQAECDSPGVKPAAGSRDQKDARKAKGGADPADRRHPFAKDRAGGEHEKNRRDVDDRHRLGHRHGAESEKHRHGRHDKAKGAEQHEAGPLRMPDGGAVARAHGDGDKGKVDPIAGRQDQRRGVDHRQMLAQRVARGKQQSR